MEFWIDHPYCDAPVSFWRWAQWKVGTKLEAVGNWLQWRGIDPHDEIEIPF